MNYSSLYIIIYSIWAGDFSRFNKAVSRRNELLAERKFSASRKVGRTAVLVSHHLGLLEATALPVVRELMVADATEYGQYIGRKVHNETGRSPILIQDAKSFEFQEILADRAVSDVVVLGHGTLPFVYMENPGTSGGGIRFDWRDVSEATTHLKQGRFEQRTCGRTDRSLNVPLGAFAMADTAQVFGPLVAEFTPEPTGDLQEERIGTVLAGVPLEYASMLAQFPRGER